MCNTVKEEWWTNGFTIVSNLPTGHDTRTDVQANGGHLVAESIKDPKIRAKILALPELLEAVAAILKPYDQDTGHEGVPEMEFLRDAYNKAMGGGKELL